ncbi:MAG: M50 family metallopeptidase [Bacteroidales bacterium]|jgi:hypothetical protein|nr:M50 family metallopeptidase [Bacteroidales bacterium]
MSSQEYALAFYGIMLLSIISIRLPRIGRFARVANTMIHESGHAFMALLLNGKVISVELFDDTSGTAKTSSGKTAGFFIALSGYIFSSMMAYLLFFLLHHQLIDLILWLFGGLALINLLFFVRNRFGMFWLLCFTALHAAAIYYPFQQFKWLTASIFSMVVLSDSVMSTLVLLYISLTDRKKAGDAWILRQKTSIPTIIWALLFVVISGLIAYVIVSRFFPIPETIF